MRTGKADGQTDMGKLRVTFRNFANEPKNLINDWQNIIQEYSPTSFLFYFSEDVSQ